MAFHQVGTPVKSLVDRVAARIGRDGSQEAAGLAVQRQTEVLAGHRRLQQVVAVDASVVIIGDAVRQEKGLQDQLQAPSDVR